MDLPRAVVGKASSFWTSSWTRFFSAHSDSRLDGGTDSVGGLGLGGRLQGDLPGVPAHLPGGVGNGGVDGGQTFLQHTHRITFP